MRNDKEKEHAPKDLKHPLDNVEFPGYQRRGYLVQLISGSGADAQGGTDDARLKIERVCQCQ